MFLLLEVLFFMIEDLINPDHKITVFISYFVSAIINPVRV
jgi:hypothetical protein